MAALEVNEGGLCLCSYPWNNPETVLLIFKPHLFLTHTEVSELVIISTGEPVYYSEGKAGTQEAVWNCESKIIKLGCVNNGNCYRTEII